MNIFVDGSYSPQKNIGVGAYIIISEDELNALTKLTIAELKIKLANDIIYSTFTDAKGSTDVEQRILDLALINESIEKLSLIVYTDCQKTQSTDKYNVVHVKGHNKQANRDSTDKIFDVIDKAVRKKLRQIVKNGY